MPLFQGDEILALWIIWGVALLICIGVVAYSKLAKAPGDLWAEAFVPLPDGKSIKVDIGAPTEMEWPEPVEDFRAEDINWKIKISNSVDETKRLEDKSLVRDPMLAMG